MAHAELAANRLGEPVGRYAIAYLDSARVLFAHANEGRGLVDLYFYPAAFNLRHGLELLAKQCSDYAAYELGDPAYLYVPGHSLEDAWKQAGVSREIIADDYNFGEREGLLADLEFLDGIVMKLHALDPSGTLFRYPECVEKRTRKRVTVRGPRREDKHVPFDRVDLAAWMGDAAAAVSAAQALVAYLDERSSWFQLHRNDPPVRLADLVMKNVPQRARDLWASISRRARPPAPPDTPE